MAAKIFASPQFSSQGRGEGDDGTPVDDCADSGPRLDLDAILRQTAAEIGEGTFQPVESGIVATVLYLDTEATTTAEGASNIDAMNSELKRRIEEIAHECSVPG